MKFTRTMHCGGVSCVPPPVALAFRSLTSKSIAGTLVRASCVQWHTQARGFSGAFPAFFLLLTTKLSVTSPQQKSTICMAQYTTPQSTDCILPLCCSFGFGRCVTCFDLSHVRTVPILSLLLCYFFVRCFAFSLHQHHSEIPINDAHGWISMRTTRSCNADATVLTGLLCKCTCRISQNQVLGVRRRLKTSWMC